MSRRIGSCLLLLLAAGGARDLFGKPDYSFDGKISREVLEHYLARSITMTEIYRSPGNLDDDIRMLKNIGAKFAGSPRGKPEEALGNRDRFHRAEDRDLPDPAAQREEERRISGPGA